MKYLVQNRLWGNFGTFNFISGQYTVVVYLMILQFSQNSRMQIEGHIYHCANPFLTIRTFLKCS